MPSNPNGLPNSDVITVLNAHGEVALSLQSIPASSKPAEIRKVVSCYDIDSDGFMELIALLNPGGTGANEVTTTVYELNDPVTTELAFSGIIAEAADLDGKQPIELIGTDFRWQYYATSGNYSTYPVIIIHSNQGSPTVVTSQFPDVVTADRQKHIGELPPCLELVRTTYNSGFDACHIGVLTSIMIDSLLLGDWDTFRQQSTIDRVVADRLEKCRSWILDKATKLTPPSSFCFPSP